MTTEEVQKATVDLPIANPKPIHIIQDQTNPSIEYWQYEKKQVSSSLLGSVIDSPKTLGLLILTFENKKLQKAEILYPDTKEPVPLPLPEK
jgi:hypothetical protein